MATATVTALGSACSVLTSLDGYAGGDRADAAIASGIDAAPPDAAIDAGDASRPPDAGRFCADKSGFCVDFDGPEGVGTWNGSSVSSNATAGVDTQDSVSPTGSLLVTVSAGGTAACFRKDIASGFSEIDVDFDVRVEKVGTADFDLARLGGTTDHSLSIQVNGALSGKLQFDQDIVPVTDGGAEEVLTSTSFSFDGAWHHVRWTNRMATSTADAELFVDGTKVGAFTAAIADYAGPTTLEIGDCLVRSSPWRIRYDDVQLVVK